MKTFYNVVNAIICCAKEARALITGNPGSLLVSRKYGAKFRSGILLEMEIKIDETYHVASCCCP